MADSSLAKKLLIKPGQRVAIMNAPAGYLARLGELPAGVQVSESLTGQFDLVLAFCKNSKELEALALKLKAALKPNGILWIAYPKQSAKVVTDLNRDVLRGLADTRGLTGVSLVSIDETWSAMRFKPKE
ncbi:MAG: hypothetical protein HY671_05160 [Chloroflexi bacterium]|nr:hypothetical protein [Chloroflexota bacterium]